MGLVFERRLRRGFVGYPERQSKMQNHAITPWRSPSRVMRRVF
jgi:hypothetical protein